MYSDWPHGWLVSFQRNGDMRKTIRHIVEGYKSLKLVDGEEGVVQFKGLDPDSLQNVMIKILPQVLGDDPQIAARFKGLGRTIRQLNHPNIASIRQVGQEEGLPYIVTRAIEKGQPLAQKVGQPWAIDAAADIVMQTGHALEHAYNKGVVHGSLSPESIVVQDDGRVVVTDFGVAEMKALIGEQLDQAAGPYLSPERATGEAADAQSDVYSLAAVLYSMLTNRNPQVVNGQVLPPSRFNPDVPPEMDKVVLRALATDPEDRYPDVKSFLAAFGSVTLAPRVKRRQSADGSTQCPQCGTKNQTGRFCRKCGQRLTEPASMRAVPTDSKLDEPIQVTRIDVGSLEMGKGIELHETTIMQPLSVATGEVQNQFPDLLEMPKLDLAELWPTTGDEPLIAMPEPPVMPVIDWAEVAPPMPEVPSVENGSTTASHEDA
jgi:serine/threonine protein kinase